MGRCVEECTGGRAERLGDGFGEGFGVAAGVGECSDEGGGDDGGRDDWPGDDDGEADGDADSDDGAGAGDEEDDICGNSVVSSRASDSGFTGAAARTGRRGTITRAARLNTL